MESLAQSYLVAQVATFFNGSNFVVNKMNITNSLQPVISQWANGSHGLDALLDPWNLVLGLAVMFLSRILGTFYIINNVNDAAIQERSKRQLLVNTVPFLVLFLSFLIRTLLKDGFAENVNDGSIYMEPMKYLNNFVTMWYLLVVLLVGVLMLLYALGKTLFTKNYTKGIWFAAIGVVLVVLSLLLCAGWNHTAYYPSNIDIQSSLTISNSCSSLFTLQTMSVVSILVPFVVALYCLRLVCNGQEKTR